MHGFLICLPILVFITILVLIFRGQGSDQKKKLCQKIGSSSDIDYIIKYIGGGNYDLNGNTVSYTTVSSDAEVKKAANERLTQIAKETNDSEQLFKIIKGTGCHVEARKAAEDRLRYLAQEIDDPDLLLKINDRVTLDQTLCTKIIAQYSAEDLLLKIYPRIEPERSVLEKAVDQISDDNTLAEIGERIALPIEINFRALSRISDPDILYPILFKHTRSLEDLDAYSFDEAKKHGYGVYLCKNDQHDFDEWRFVDEKTDKIEGADLQDVDKIRKCRRCGKIMGGTWSDSYHEWHYKLIAPGKYDS